MAGAARQSGTQRARGVAFGPSNSGALLTYVGSRWRLWWEATEDKALEVSHSDPAESYTASCWGPDGDEEGRKGAAGQVFALGCASGRVQVWDSRSGELVGPTAKAFAAVAKGTDARVSALALSSHRRGSVFVGCGTLPDVLEVGIADGVTRSSIKVGKVGIAQLTLSGGPSEWLLTACPNSTMRLWSLPDTSKGAKALPPVQRMRLAGPADTTSGLDMYCSGGKVLALCADGTMQVDVFVCDASTAAVDDKKQPPLSSAFVLSAHEQIRTARFVRQVAEGRATVLGFGGTVIACWNLRLDRAGKNGTPRTVASAFVVLAAELGGRVLSARPAAELQDKSNPLIIAYGATANPSFAKLRAPAAKGEAAVIERSVDAAGQAPKPAADGAAKPGAEVAAAATKKTPTILGPLEANVERTQPKKRQLGDIDKELEAGNRKRLQLPDGGKAQGGLSVTPMVRQALRAKDTASMEKVLQIADHKVIDCTVSELTGAEAFDLMQECTHRIMTQPIRGPIFCRWIQRVTLRHGAFLFSQPILHRALQPLHDVFTARCSSNKNLVRLQGRLQTLKYSGRALVEENKNTKSNEDVAKAPLLEYTEGDEDNLAEDASQDGDASSASGAGEDEDGSGLDDFGSDDDDILIDGFD